MKQDAIFIGRQLTTVTKDWLNKKKVAYKEQALIDITLTSVKDTHWSRLPSSRKSWIVTSQWSALWLAQYHQEIGFTPNDKLYCLSKKQAKTLDGLAAQCFVAQQSGVSSLVQKIKEKNTGEVIIYLKGNRSLKLIEDELRLPTYTVKTMKVYNNTLLPVQLSKEFAAYLFFSPSGIQSFIEANNELPHRASIFTIGPTTGHKAKSTFSNPVYESSSQDELEFIKSAVDKLNAKNDYETIR